MPTAQAARIAIAFRTSWWKRPAPSSKTSRKALTSWVRGRAWIKGWALLPKLSVAKKTPESRYIGSMTRFISPLTVSVVVARLATSRPIPAKARAPMTSTRKKQQVAADRHVEDERSQEQQHRDVGDQEGQARGQDGAQEVAPGHGRGDEALEQLADPQIHQEEADAPEAAAHGVEADQPRDQEDRYSVIRAR